ncbi:MAG: hypothetical protein NC112_06560 [Oxalobacter formigenes]|nr:hypothetical protein [Oxalobacter formigenes]
MKKIFLYPLLFVLAGNICLAQDQQPVPPGSLASAVPGTDARPADTAVPEETPILKTSEKTPPAPQANPEPESKKTLPSVPAEADIKAPSLPAEQKTIQLSQEKKENTALQKNASDIAETKKQAETTDTRETAAERRSRQARILANMAIDLMAHENYGLAEKKLQEALKIDPHLASAYCNMALFDWRAENQEAAFMNIETCFIKGFRDFKKLEEDTDFGDIVSDRRYEALKNRYQ